MAKIKFEIHTHEPGKRYDYGGNDGEIWFPCSKEEFDKKLKELGGNPDDPSTWHIGLDEDQEFAHLIQLWFQHGTVDNSYEVLDYLSYLVAGLTDEQLLLLEYVYCAYGQDYLLEDLVMMLDNFELRQSDEGLIVSRKDGSDE